MDSTINLLFDVTRDGETTQWSLRCTNYHSVDDIILFYRIQSNDWACKVRCELNGTPVATNTMIVSTIIAVKPTARVSGLELFVYDGSPDSSDTVDHNAEQITLNFYGSITLSYHALVSDSIRHIKKEVLKDAANEFHVRIAHTGKCVVDESLTLGELLSLDVAPLFDVDIDVSPALLTDIIFDMTFIDFGDPYLSTFLSKGLRVHQVRLILTKILGWKPIMMRKGREINDRLSINEICDDGEDECSISLQKPRRISYVSDQESVRYEISLDSKKVVLEESLCFVVEKPGDPPYLVVSPKGVATLKAEFGEKTLQKVYVSLDDADYSDGSTLEQHSFEDSPFSGGADNNTGINENEGIDVAEEPPVPPEHLQMALDHQQQVVHLIVFGLAGVALSALYIDINTLAAFAFLVCIAHVPIAIFGPQVATFIERLNRFAFRPDEVLYLQIAVRGYCYLLRNAHTVAYVASKYIIALCVSRPYRHQRAFRQENFGILKRFIAQTAATSMDLIKDVALGFLTFIPTLEPIVRSEVRAWNDAEISLLGHDLCTFAHDIENVFNRKERTSDDDERLTELYNRLHEISFTLNDDNSPEPSDELYGAGIHAYREAQSFLRELDN